ncbi:PIN-like domain-containing protein [Crossiella sp. CA198]|uniref:PIN-like domain-containing protein n=1 Tax=Crossiella sp. CA198 TaxID=3455607 RepID=UPI003F8D880B
MSGEPAAEDDVGDLTLKVDWRIHLSDLNTGTLVLDSSYILCAYRPVPSAQTVLDDLWSVRDRIWVPHQVMLEITGRGATVENDFRKETVEQGESFRRGIQQKLLRLRVSMRRNEVERQAEQLAVRKFHAATEEMVNFAQNRGDAARPSPRTPEELESINQRLERLIKGRVGPAPTPEERSAWITDSTARIKSKRPPSYADRKHRPGQRANDCIIWHQIMQLARNQEPRKPIVFVTQDHKNLGWVEHRGGRPVGAHSLLVDEMHEEAGVPFLVIGASQLHSYIEHLAGSEVWHPDRAWAETTPAGLLRPLPTFLHDAN